MSGSGGFARHFSVLDSISVVCSGEAELHGTVLHVPCSVIVGDDPLVVRKDLAVFDIVPYAVLCHIETAVVEVDFPVSDHPGAVLVVGESVVSEIDFTVLYFPPAVEVLEHSIGIEIDLAVFDAPPAIVVLGDAGVLEVDDSPDDSPPAVAVFGNAGVVDAGSVGLLHGDPALPHLFDREALAGPDDRVGPCFGRRCIT